MVNKLAGHFNGSKSEMMTINYSGSEDSLLLPTTDVSSPAAGEASKEALDTKKLAEVAERIKKANLEQETQTLADPFPSFNASINSVFLTSLCHDWNILQLSAQCLKVVVGELATLLCKVL